MEIAADAIGLPVDDTRGVTVTGGMGLFGGPGNNYSTHAIAEMAKRLREEGSRLGVVTANGGYLTKQSIGIYASEPGANPFALADRAAIDAELAKRPRVTSTADASGALTLEAHTVRFRAGERFEGIVIGRLDDGRRSVAVSSDASTMERLATEDCVELTGQAEHRDGKNHFRFEDA